MKDELDHTTSCFKTLSPWNEPQISDYMDPTTCDSMTRTKRSIQLNYMKLSVFYHFAAKIITYGLTSYCFYKTVSKTFKRDGLNTKYDYLSANTQDHQQWWKWYKLISLTYKIQNLFNVGAALKMKKSINFLWKHYFSYIGFTLIT